MRNAGLDGVQRSIARGGISEHKCGRQLPGEPGLSISWSKPGDAVVSVKRLITFNPDEAPAVEENAAVEVARRIERKSLRCVIGGRFASRQ